MDTAGYVVLVTFISALIVAAFVSLCVYVVLYRRRFCRGCSCVPDDYERSVASSSVRSFRSSSVRSFHVDSHMSHPAGTPLSPDEVLLHRLFWNSQRKLRQPIAFTQETPTANTTPPFVACTPVPIIRRGTQEMAYSQFPVDKKSNLAPEDLAVARFRQRYGSKLLSGVSEGAIKEEKVAPTADVDLKGSKEDAITIEVQVQAVAGDGKGGKENHDVHEGTIQETAVEFYTPPASPLNDDIF